jgi:hypothetical protein
MDEQMPQSFAKRGREETGDTEYTGTYPVLPQTSVPPVEDPNPMRDTRVTIDTATPHLPPQQLREEARTAFLAQPMLP